MRVGGLDADATLPVHGRGLTERANQNGLRLHHRSDHGAHTPNGRLLHDRTVAVFTLEEPTTEVLTVAVLAEAEVLVVDGVDHDTIGGEAGGGGDLGRGAEDRVWVVRDGGCGLGLDAGAVQQTLDVGAGAVTVEELRLLREAEQVHASVVDLGDEEPEVLDHLVGELQDTRDLLQTIGLHRGICEVHRRLQRAFSHRTETTLDEGSLNEVGHRVVVGQGTGTEQVREDQTTAVSPNDRTIVEGRVRLETGGGGLRVVRCLNELGSREGGVRDALLGDHLRADMLDEPLAWGLRLVLLTLLLLLLLLGVELSNRLHERLGVVFTCDLGLDGIQLDEQAVGLLDLIV